MSEEGGTTDGARDPVDKILDTVFYGPVGALSGLSGDPSGHAERGREAVALQLSNAKFLGQMVVTYGSKEIARRAGDLWTSTVRSASSTRSEGNKAPASPASDSQEGPTTAPVAAAPIDHLIAGYDDLSASQVVRLLDGLLSGELTELSSYEAATRNRRTILNRVAQLLEEPNKHP